MKDRLDKVLVERGLASTRSQAAQLIKEGVVYVSNKQVLKSSVKVSDEEIEVKKSEQFVGRGAHKMEGALKSFGLTFENKIIADVGASTGGFTDFALSRGALKSYAIDVGHGQLAKALLEDERVHNYEGVNIREGLELPEKVDMAVVDLSFISLKLVFEKIFELVSENGEVVALVKPQFEVGKEGIDKGGIVKSPKLALNSTLSLFDFCEEKGFDVIGFSLCSIQGKTGNQEFFFYFKKGTKSNEDIRNKIENMRELK